MKVSELIQDLSSLSDEDIGIEVFGVVYPIEDMGFRNHVKMQVLIASDEPAEEVD